VVLPGGPAPLNPKVLGQHLRRGMRQPVGHQQCVEFGRVDVIEGEHKLASIGFQALQGWRLGLEFKSGGHEIARSATQRL
jgi:hypothetical protein